MALNIKQERFCLFCGRQLYGRTDKKYCDDNCRNNHHYDIKKNNDESVKKVNAVLLHNRDVLRLLNNGSRSLVKKQLLINHCFDFDVITGLYKTKKGMEYRVVYDYAYRNVNEDDVLLIRFRE